MKTTILFCFAFASLAPAADTAISSIFDSQLTGIEREIMPLVQEVPESAFAFAPKEGAFTKARTFAQQAKHVATVMFMVAAAAKSERPPLDLGGGEDGPDGIKTKAQVIQYLTDAFAYAHKAMRGLTAENIVEMVKSPFGSGQMARGAVANIAITHTFDHYGQMAIYARMNNVVPPASR